MYSGSRTTLTRGEAESLRGGRSDSSRSRVQLDEAEAGAVVADAGTGAAEEVGEALVCTEIILGSAALPTTYRTET